MDTIAALSTPPGKGGIGIVRISGNIALEIVDKIFILKNKHGIEGKKAPSGKIRYGHIVEPRKKEIIDEAIVFSMPAPNSYTREDVVEIQIHAGPAVLEKVITVVLEQGARLAEPGEFTKRAFLNGRIDLTMAEAVLDLVEAKSEAARKIAGKQLQGKLNAKLLEIKSNISECLAEIEADIDFSDDTDGFELDRRRWETNILEPLKKLHRGAKAGTILKNGVKIAFAGKPNVGKRA